ncbi:MAG: hypothetical protein GY822_22695 [Deltaproteobacteria bacterium]|nr:hypothetical protein [Deltaproteobacteria bacterium]
MVQPQGTTSQSLVWFSDWHRWLPAVLKPDNFERLAAEGAALFGEMGNEKKHLKPNLATLK